MRLQVRKPKMMKIIEKPGKRRLTVAKELKTKELKTKVCYLLVMMMSNSNYNNYYCSFHCNYIYNNNYLQCTVRVAPLTTSLVMYNFTMQISVRYADKAYFIDTRSGVDQLGESRGHAPGLLIR